jgi:hypothetical protein
VVKKEDRNTKQGPWKIKEVVLHYLQSAQLNLLEKRTKKEKLNVYPIHLNLLSLTSAKTAIVVIINLITDEVSSPTAQNIK